jgi:acyl carrier protein
MNKRTRILEILRSASKKDLDPEPGESLFDSGLLDSFALPDVVSALEKEFSLSIPDSDLNPRKFDSVARIERYLEERGV